MRNLGFILIILIAIHPSLHGLSIKSLSIPECFEESSRVVVGTLERDRGGYFVSLDIPDGLATRVITLTKEAGVALTQAGAPFPYGKDPRDRNIRIAPTFPKVEDVRQAMEVLCLCVLLAIAESAEG